jgi:hypothetical protein
MDNLTNTEPLLARRPGVELHYSQRPMPGNSGANGTQHTVALEYGTDSEQDELLMLVHSCLGDRGQRLPHGTTFLATLVGSQFRVVDSGARRLARSGGACSPGCFNHVNQRRGAFPRKRPTGTPARGRFNGGSRSPGLWICAAVWPSRLPFGTSDTIRQPLAAYSCRRSSGTVAFVTHQVPS